MKKFLILSCLMAAASVFANAATNEVLTPMKPLMFKGKPFMPLGLYDGAYSGFSGWIAPDFLKAGCNVMIVGPNNACRNCYTQRMSFIRSTAKKYPDIAIIVAIESSLTCGFNGKGRIPPEEVPARMQMLRDMVRECKAAGNVIGYYYDEPENAYYKFYRDWEKSKDKGLTKFMISELSWIGKVIKEEDPDAYLMPLIAWWTTYKDLGPLYDVLIANEYSTPQDLFQIVLDARRAVAAVRDNKKHSMVYMPATFNILGGKWEKVRYTPAEQRYAILAPVVCGSMGTIGWRLHRCTKDYADNVVFPAIRELKELEPWVLGEWHEQNVSSDRDTATADYLKKAPLRIKLTDDEDAEEVVTEGIPDVVYTLRRRADTGEWLLLAACNRREGIDVQFFFKDLPGKLSRVYECSNGAHKEIEVKNGAFSDKMNSFEIKRYQFTLE